MALFHILWHGLGGGGLQLGSLGLVYKPYAESTLESVPLFSNIRKLKIQCIDTIYHSGAMSRFDTQNRSIYFH